MIDRDALGIVCAEHGRIALYTDQAAPLAGGTTTDWERLEHKRKERAERAAFDHLRTHHPRLLAVLAATTITKVAR